MEFKITRPPDRQKIKATRADIKENIFILFFFNLLRPLLFYSTKKLPERRFSELSSPYGKQSESGSGKTPPFRISILRLFDYWTKLELILYNFKIILNNYQNK